MAYDFDGSNDGIVLGTSAALNPTTLTIAAWVNFNSVATDQWILARDDETDGRSFAFGLGNDGSGIKTQFQINGSAEAKTTTLPSAGTWTSMAGKGQSGAWETYIGGLSVATSTTVLTPGSTTGPTTIAHRTYSGFEGFFNGRIAEVGFWNTVLTADEIAALAKYYSPPLIRPQNLIAYIPLIRNLINVVGSTPTLVDAPTVAVHPRIIMPRLRRPRWSTIIPVVPPETLFAQACL